MLKLTIMYYTFFRMLEALCTSYKSHTNTILSRKLWPEIKKKSTWQSAKKLYTTLQICSFKNSFCKIVNVLKEIEEKEIVTKSFSEKKKWPLDGNNVV